MEMGTTIFEAPLSNVGNADLMTRVKDMAENIGIAEGVGND